MPPTETPEEKKKREEDEAAAEAAAEADAKLNGAVKNHVERALKKAMAELTKSVTEQISQAVAGLKQPAPTDEDKSKQGKGGEKIDPSVKLLQEEVERLKKQSADDRAARDAAEKTARTKETRTTIREALDKIGIKGARATALISHFETTGVVSYDEDGKVKFSSTRVRAKGGQPDTLEFPDLATGIADWAKGEEAAEFLPAPGANANAAQAQRGQQQARPQRRISPPRDPNHVPSEEELANRASDVLAKSGIDLATAFNR